MQLKTAVVGMAMVVGLSLGVHAGQVTVGPMDPAGFMARIEGPQSPNRQGLDALTLAEVMQKFRVPGVSVAVIKDFNIHWAKAYGVADVERGQPVQTDSLFQAASISKPVTAMAVMSLVQEGRISLDADVNTFLKSWQVPKSDHTRNTPVTLRGLLSHTSGADDGFGFPGYELSAARPTAVQIIEGQKPSNVGPVLFARPPFQASKYSGGGYVIVQLALTDLLGQPFAEIMRTRILAPLSMTSSSFEQPLPYALRTRASRAHSGQGKPMGPPWHVYPEQAAAGLWTTPTDLARFAIEIQRALQDREPALLKQHAAREMLAPTGVGPMGVGVRLELRNEGWYFAHGGSNWGFRANMLAHVRKGYGVVTMTNGEVGQPVIAEIEARVAAAYGWDSLDKPLVR